MITPSKEDKAHPHTSILRQGRCHKSQEVRPSDHCTYLSFPTTQFERLVTKESWGQHLLGGALISGSPELHGETKKSCRPLTNQNIFFQLSQWVSQVTQHQPSVGTIIDEKSSAWVIYCIQHMPKEQCQVIPGRKGELFTSTWDAGKSSLNAGGYSISKRQSSEMGRVFYLRLKELLGRVSSFLLTIKKAIKLRKAEGKGGEVERKNILFQKQPHSEKRHKSLQLLPS